MATRILFTISDPISLVLLSGQLRHLADDDFDVHLAVSVNADARAFATSEHVTVHDLPLQRDPSPVADLRALWALYRVCRTIRPAIVNSSTPKAGLLGTLAATAARVPVRVYVVRGLRFEGGRGAGRVVMRALERLTTATATDVVFNSRSSLDVSRNERTVARQKGLVLHNGSGNGVDVSRFDPARRSEVRARLGIGPDERVLGFVGRLTGDKGITDALTVLDQAIADLGDARLLVVGAADREGALSIPVRKRLQSDPSIICTGWLPDITSLYSAMDILVFPSVREGLPNAPLEAQASGVPVVAYAATGTVDAVEDGETGLLVPVGDVNALADACIKLLQDDRLRARIGGAGRSWVAGTFAQRDLWQAWSEHYRFLLQ
jgi:glycosyltransferase involved in cell wall biosynthesis